MQSTPGDGESGADARAAGRPEAFARRAFVGVVWTMATSVGARLIGLLGTLLLTRFIDPDVYGEASLAAVVVMTTYVSSSFGLTQYIIARPHEGRAAMFHVTFYFLLLGVVALGATVLFRERIGAMIHAPGVAAYIPGLALAALLDRVSVLPDRILTRDLRFQSVGIQRSLGDVVYVVVSVGLAFAGWGGAAILWASIARSSLRLVTLTATAPRREWLEPCRLTWRRTRALFAFGLPMTCASIAAFGSRRWDNILIGRRFGQSIAGLYNLAYNLADIPATQIGETVGDVLAPSFAQMASAEQQKRALLLSMRLLFLLVAPLAIGLGAIAETLVQTFFDARWGGVAGMLIVLSGLSVVRPVGWIGNAYLQVKNRPREVMVLEVAKTAGLLALITVFQDLHRTASLLGLPGLAAILERSSVLLACGAVGVAFALNSLGYMWVIRRLDGLSLRAQILPLLPPIVACVPMVLAVVGLRVALAERALPALARLAAETSCGVIVFIPSAWLFANAASKELCALVRSALVRRGEASAADGAALTTPTAPSGPPASKGGL